MTYSDRSFAEWPGHGQITPQPATAPTTLAVVDVDRAGAPRYRFYLAGTSSPALEYPLLPAALPDGVTALHSGSLALVMEPIATSIERLIASDMPPGTLVMIDPNCRSDAITDQDAYQARLSRILRRTDVVGRLGGEEFGAILPGDGLTEVAVVAAPLPGPPRVSSASLNSPIGL